MASYCVTTGTMILLLLAATSTNAVSLTDNGYSGIVVGISPNISQDQGQVIINAIKDMFQNGSQVLYTATGKRAYYANVTILIPTTWQNFSIDRVAQSEVYEESDVRVMPPNPQYGDNPYTLQPGGCGMAGEYIHLTPDYLQNLNTTSTDYYGPPGKVLVHEWAHLRYGVFEEYGYPGDDMYPLFYFGEDEVGELAIIPNACTNKPADGYFMDVQDQGDCRYDPETGLPDEYCRFFPYDNDPDVTSSLMSYTYLQSVDHFCNNSEEHQHQTGAPTKQNFLCGQMSVWEVINQHDDFASGRNPAASRDPEELVPRFEVVRQENAHFIMVLDTSSSMKGDRIARLHAAATKWIKYELQNGTWLAIVTFTTTSKEEMDFLQLNDDASRNQAASHVPSKADGGTCICNGIDRALKVLKAADVDGGVMILMTDGEENQGCSNPNPAGGTWDLTDLYQPVQEAGVRVVTMAFSESADSRLEKFAEISDGKTYFISDHTTALDLDQAFYGCLTYQPDITVETEKDIVLFQQRFSGAVASFTGYFSVDATTGRDLVFKLDLDDASKFGTIESVTLTSPNDTAYDNFQQTGQEDFGTLEIPMAEEGDWRFDVDFAGSSADSVITVTSKARSEHVLPLTTTCWMSATGDVNVSSSTRLAALARVKQGNNAVLNATVTAYVTTPAGGYPVELQLSDNGVGADTVADDGVYAKYFTQFNGKGRYAVVCEVKDDGHAVINEGFSASGVQPDVSQTTSNWCCGSRSPVGATRPTGNFTRQGSGGAFQVTNQVSGDVLPPSQVTDLRVQSRRLADREVTLSWTAPGDDLDQGTATRYVFKWCNQSAGLSEALFDVEGVEVNSSLVPDPEPSGTVQQINLTLPDGLQKIYVAMKALDEKGNKAMVSNLAVPTVIAAPPRPPDDSGLSTGAIVGIVVGLLVAVVLVLAVIVTLRARQRRVFNDLHVN